MCKVEKSYLFLKCLVSQINIEPKLKDHQSHAPVKI